MGNNGNGYSFKEYILEEKPVFWTKLLLVPRCVRAFSHDSGKIGLSVKTVNPPEECRGQAFSSDRVLFTTPSTIKDRRLMIVDYRPQSMLFYDRLEKWNRESLLDFLRAFRQPAALSFRLRRSRRSDEEYFSVVLDSLPSGIEPRWLFGSYCFSDSSGINRYQINKQKSCPRFVHSMGQPLSGYSIYLTALTGEGESLVVEKVLSGTEEVVEEIEISETVRRHPLTLSAA